MCLCDLSWKEFFFILSFNMSVRSIVMLDVCVCVCAGWGGGVGEGLESTDNYVLYITIIIPSIGIKRPEQTV